jgi:ADP-ribose pyrophosphatase YjhB (NUDIX family)
MIVRKTIFEAFEKRGKEQSRDELLWPGVNSINDLTSFGEALHNGIPVSVITKPDVMEKVYESIRQNPQSISFFISLAQEFDFDVPEHLITSAYALETAIEKDIKISREKINQILDEITTVEDLYVLRDLLPENENDIYRTYKSNKGAGTVTLDRAQQIVDNQIEVTNVRDLRNLSYLNLTIPERIINSLTPKDLMILGEQTEDSDLVIRGIDKLVENKEELPWKFVKNLFEYWTRTLNTYPPRSDEDIEKTKKNISNVLTHIKKIFPDLHPDEKLICGVILQDFDLIKTALEDGAEFAEKYTFLYRRTPAKIKKELVKGGFDTVLLQRGWQTYNALKFIKKHGKEGVHYRKIKEFMYDSEWGDGEWRKMESAFNTQHPEERFFYGSVSGFNPPSKYTTRRPEKGKRRFYLVNNDGMKFIREFEKKMKKNKAFIIETLNEWKNSRGVRATAGLVIIQNNKILLVHPTNSPWYGTYSIPKGGLDKKEDPLEAALRETEEETGIKIKRKHISNKDAGYVDYTDKKGKVYKRVYYFIAYPKKEITNDMFNPQMKEVDWVGFLDKQEAKKRIFGRFKPLLKFLK